MSREIVVKDKNDENVIFEYIIKFEYLTDFQKFPQKKKFIKMQKKKGFFYFLRYSRTLSLGIYVV